MPDDHRTEADDPGVSAPQVFRDLSQEALDRAYDQSFWAVNGAEVQARIVARSTAVAQDTPPVTRRTGPGDMQHVDIFAPPGSRNAPVFVMIHGGAWQLAMREAFCGPAPPIMAAGGIFVVVGFDCLPRIGIPAMAAQIAQSLAWIGREIGAFGGDGRNLHLIGHSSGAHLAAVIMTADPATLDLPPCSLGSATLLSGLYDLQPPMLSARRHFMKLTPDEVAALSPIRHLERFTGSAIVAWGSAESPEFIRQSEAFATALGDNGRLDRAFAMPGLNHYETLEALNDPEDGIVGAMLKYAIR
jgi:arylformamidase